MSVTIFFCYAHEDEALLNKLKLHLRPLQRQGLIDVWHDRDISAGTEWEQEIKKHLNAAKIILLLISPDFMDSDYCYSIEMQRALERHQRGEARVIPIILRAVLWQGILGNLQALPTDAKPVKSWSDVDEAFLDVADGIRKVVVQFGPKPISLPDMPALRKLSSEGSTKFNPPEYQIQVNLSTSEKIDMLENEDAKTDSTKSRIKEAQATLFELRRQDRNAFYRACARWSEKAEKARKDEDWEEEGICWEILRDFEPYIAQSRERRKIVKENQEHKRIYDEAKQCAETRDKKAIKEKLLELWQKAPFYGDPARLAWRAGLYIPLGGWHRTVWMSFFWSGFVSSLSLIIALILAGTNIPGSQYFTTLSGILAILTLIIFLVFFYLNYRWIYLKFAFISTPTSTTTNPGVNSTRINPPQNKTKNR